MDPATLASLERIHEHFVAEDDNLIAVLQAMQQEFGHVPEEAVRWFSKKSGIPASKFYGVVTFYAQFYLEPRGKNIITACCGTVCHVKGSHRIISRLRSELGLKGEDKTTKDRQFTLESVNCVGACSIAPVVIVNGTVHGNMNPDKAMKTIKAGKEPEK
jgi:NADH:ubiquinone oxidoreductase subunit E